MRNRIGFAILILVPLVLAPAPVEAAPSYSAYFAGCNFDLSCHSVTVFWKYVDDPLYPILGWVRGEHLFPGALGGLPLSYDLTPKPINAVAGYNEEFFRYFLDEGDGLEFLVEEADWRPETLSLQVMYGEVGENHHIDPSDDRWIDVVPLTRVVGIPEPPIGSLLAANLAVLALVAMRHRRRRLV